MVTLTHRGLPQLQPHAVPENVQLSAECRSVFFSGDSNRLVYKIYVVNCPNGPFLPSEIGEIYRMQRYL